MEKILNALLEDYIKIIRINIETGTFKEVKIIPEEKVFYTGINQWFIEFANSSRIVEDDKKEFLENANLGTIVENLRIRKEFSFLYRRNFNNSVHWMKMACRYVDENKDEILLTVRDVSMRPKVIQPFTKADIIKQFKDFESEHAAVGLAIIEFKKENSVRFYETMKKLYESCYPTIKYDSTHYIIYALDKARDEIFPLLAQLYQNLKDLDVNIGYTWTDEDWDFNSLIAKAATNLQVNK